jgi:hypothetical protein
MKTLYRSLVMAAMCGALSLVAQDRPVPNKAQPVPQQQRDQPPPADIDENARRAREKSAGNPAAEQHPPTTFPDAGLSSVVLDAGQRERIQRMDERYADQLRRLGPVNRSDPAYQQLWSRREQEIATILTPVQFEKWQEMNKSYAEGAQPVPMPNAEPDERPVTPLPQVQIDSTRDPMPRVDTIPAPPPPPKEPK